MATICLGVWTTHGPNLVTTPEQWMLRVPADKSIRHWYRGRQYSFEELLDLGNREDFASQITLQERTLRAGRNTASMKELASIWSDIQPDVAVIMGNDQRELIMDSLQPMFTIYHGETFWHAPLDPDQKAPAPGIRVSEKGYRPDRHTIWPGLPELAELVIDRSVCEGFDVAVMKEWPEMTDHWHIGTPHSFSYVIRQVMKDRAVPVLPVITNTFFPPNQPTAQRCFDFGRLIAQVIHDWDSDLNVAVFGSGGMSHFRIDEELDRETIRAIQERDSDYLVSISQNYLMQGTSELRNWISAAGIMFSTDLAGEVIDYVPCYRSEAGTGTAQGFVYWR